MEALSKEEILNRYRKLILESKEKIERILIEVVESYAEVVKEFFPASNEDFLNNLDKIESMGILPPFKIIGSYMTIQRELQTILILKGALQHELWGCVDFCDSNIYPTSKEEKDSK